MLCGSSTEQRQGTDGELRENEGHERFVQHLSAQSTCCRTEGHTALHAQPDAAAVPLAWPLLSPPPLLQALAPAAPEAASLVVCGSSLDCASLACSLAVRPVGLADVEARLAVADPGLHREYQVTTSG